MSQNELLPEASVPEGWVLIERKVIPEVANRGGCSALRIARHFGYDDETTVNMVFAEMLLLAATPQARPCETCNGHGLIGGFVSGDSGYQDDPCPDCTPQARPEDGTGLQALNMLVAAGFVTQFKANHAVSIALGLQAPPLVPIATHPQAAPPKGDDDEDGEPSPPTALEIEYARGFGDGVTHAEALAAISTQDNTP